MSKDAYWFPHDSNARHDPKMVRLRMKHGLAGIGFFWCCIEFLREQNEYRATMEEFEALEFEMNAKGMLQSVIDVNLLCCDDEMIFSESLRERMFKWDERKRKLSEAGKRGGRPSKSQPKAMKKGGFRQEKANRKPAESNNITGHNITGHNITGHKSNTPLPPKGAEEDFEIFWKQYPKKTGKKKCLDIWKRSKPDLQKCISTLERQKKSSQWINNNGQYVPNPSTWLNQGRWDDEEPEKLYPHDDPDGDGIPF